MLTDITQSKNGRKPAPLNFTLDDYLDDLEIRRNALIMELRNVDRRLIDSGRLKRTHVPGQYIDRNR